MSETNTQEITLTLCSECECEINLDAGDFTNHEERMYCQECFDKNFEKCEHCGDYVPRGETNTSDNGDTYCTDCYSELFTICHNCDGEVSSDDAVWTHGGSYCGSCYDELFIECDYCGEIISRDYACYSEHNDRTYCESCYSDHNDSTIHDYHDFGGELYFYDSNGRHYNEQVGELYLGVELETDKYDDRENAGEELVDLSDGETLFHLEDDGSLSNGIEIISMPMSLDYHRKFKWDEIIKVVRSNGGKSHDTRTCGLHIHFNSSYISNDHDENCLKLIYIFEKFWNNFVRFSCRDYNSLEHYAKKYDMNIDDTTTSTHSKIRYAMMGGRYFAINLTHYNTIEIRIFKGTLRLETLFACIELTDFIARYIKTTNIETLQALTWDRLIYAIDHEKYPNLVAYLKSAELYPTDNQIPLFSVERVVTEEEC